MSLVIGVANKDFIIFASETRKTTTNRITKNISCDENYKKVFKINKRIIIGYAGDADYCEIVVGSLLNEAMNLREKSSLRYMDVDNFIEKRLKNVIMQVESDPIKYRKAKAYIIVGGISDKELKLSSYFYEDVLTTNKFTLNSTIPKLITLSTNKYDHEAYFKQKFLENPIINIDNFKHIFKQTLQNGVNFDSTINDNAEFVEINL